MGTMVVVWKTIKPQRLKDAEMKREVRNALDRMQRAIKKDYERTTKTWEHKVRFQTQESIKPTGPAVLVGTDDLIYKFVDEGTRPHLIRARRAPRLVFQTGYKSKTLPGVLDARHGGKFGPIATALAVQHPGTEARGFTEMLQKTWQAKFKAEMEKAMVRAARVSGHGA